ncbi:ABC transporter permease [Nonomuraea sp. NN258]|uniref:ABC transporter permease n=1 Tax=Nonomuraea antri TaxID=2730852 RepID=UPI001568E8B5|nr:ABC transporter permease [Nonomuraea antri]NRQ36493.1 ABC transporter permease [Nonomuraea antri]
MDDQQPLFKWSWLTENWDNDSPTSIVTLLQAHVLMAGVPIVLGLLIAVPLGLVCVRWRWLYQPVSGLMNAVYALPSLPLFMLLLGVTGRPQPATVIIPLTFYAVAVLMPAVVDGLGSVPEHVRQAATAMGFTHMRRLIRVDLPIAVPVVLAGLRVVAVSSISLVSVGALIGQGGLGNFFTDAFQRDFYTPAIAGIVLIVLLALVADGIIVAAQRLLTPWVRARRGT